jgi:hypothetical protein
MDEYPAWIGFPPGGLTANDTESALQTWTAVERCNGLRYNSLTPRLSACQRPKSFGITLYYQIRPKYETARLTVNSQTRLQNGQESPLLALLDDYFHDKGQSFSQRVSGSRPRFCVRPSRLVVLAELSNQRKPS